MIIDVKLFATLREYLPEGSENYTAKVPAESGAKIQNLVDWLKLPEEMPCVYLLNGRHAEARDEVTEDDVVSIFPPISGG